MCLHVCFQVIADITKRMGDGMADFIEKEVLTVKEYDLYCHYVAGLVGIGLCQVKHCHVIQHGALGPVGLILPSLHAFTRSCEPFE